MVQGPAWATKLRTLSLLYAAVFLTRIGFGAIIILFPIYLQAGSAVAAIVIALYPALEGLSAVPVGSYVDQDPRKVALDKTEGVSPWHALFHRLHVACIFLANLARGRKHVFVTGLLLMSILTLLIGLSNNLYLVGVAHGLSGFSAALITISSLTMITDLTAEDNRGTGMGAFDLSTLAGYGLGISLGGVFAKVFVGSLGDSFLIVGGILAVATSFSFFTLKEPSHVSQGRRTLREIYNSLTGDVAAIFPMWFSLAAVLGFELFIPKLVKNAGADISQSAPLILLGLVVLGVGAVLFGSVSDKIGRVKTMIIGAAGEFGFLLIFPDVFQKIVLITPGTSWLSTYESIGPIILVAAVLFFLASALLPSVLAFMADKARLGYRGTTMGLYSLLLSAGIALGTVLAGFADQIAGVQGVFYSAVVNFSGLSLTTGWLIRKHRHVL